LNEPKATTGSSHLSTMISSFMKGAECGVIAHSQQVD